MHELVSRVSGGKGQVCDMPLFSFFFTSHARNLSLPACIRGWIFSVPRILTRSSAQALKHPGSEGALDFPPFYQL
jgi:hypothetical protein